MYAQSPQKAMRYDASFNFYEVCDSAEAHFARKGKGKGSGWKGYMRWRYQNEYKYYPSGERDNVDPFFSATAYHEFLDSNPQHRNIFNGSWEDLGPYVIGQVTGHYAVGLGRVESFYVNPNDPNMMYLGSRSGGFWKTTNGGTTWVGKQTDFLDATGVNTMTVSPTNPDSILINVRNATNGNSHGVYRSTDGGDSWTQSNYNPTSVGFGGLGSSFKIYTILYHPTIPDLVFIGTSKGVYRSADNLATWTREMNSADITDIVFHPTDPSVVYAYDDYYWGSLQNEVLVSTDSGKTFTPSPTLAGNNDARLWLYTSNDCPDCIYAASSNGLWQSKDRGTTFSFILNPPDGCHGGFAVSDQDTSNILCGYVDAFMSTDGGRNFNQVTYWAIGNSTYNTTGQYIHADMRNAECINGVFYAATDGFLCKSSDNGVTWEILSFGTGIRENYSLAVSQSNHYRSICGSQDNGTSIRVENDWIEFYGADGMEGIIHPLNHDWMMGSVQYGGRRRTKDGGISQDGVTPPGQSGYWVAPFELDPNNHMRVYSFGQNVYRSDEFGDNWTTLGNPFGNLIKEAAIAHNQSNVMVVARDEEIMKSTDGGQTFSDIRGALPNYSITAITFDPNDDNTLIVTYGRYQNDGDKVFISQDQGATWQNITYNLGNLPVLSVAIDHSPEANIYVGTEIGVYTKTMAANTWSAYSPDLPNVSVRDLDIMWGSNTLRAATWGRGLWEFSLVGREDYPAIIKTSIDHLPTADKPKEGVDQYVTAEISYDQTLTSVYVAYSVNDQSFGNTLTMSNTGGNIWRSDQALPDAPEGDEVFFKVFAVGSSGDTSETYKFMYEVKEFAYCSATGDTGTGSDYIDRVALNGVQNTSGQDYYGDYTNVVIELDVDSTYTLQIDLATHFDPDTTGAWIDFDNDTEFEAHEFIEMTELNASHESFGSFTVPANAVIGDTLRMRTRSTYWNNPPEDCGNQTGEVEDYSIVVRAPAVPLPVELASFDARVTPEKTVQLAWETQNEVNHDYFTVERSVEGVQWEAIAQVDGSGNSNALQQYNSLDPDPYVGLSHYRLGYTDFDGQVGYSDIRTVVIDLGNQVRIYPNPTQDALTIEGMPEELRIFRIYDLMGREVTPQVQMLENKASRYVVDLSTLADGIYLIKTRTAVSQVYKR